MTEYVRMIMFGGFLLTAAAEDMRHRKVSRRLLLIAAVCGILLFGVWGPGYREASFIYFQF